MPIEVSEDKEFEKQFVDSAIKLFEEKNRQRISDNLLHIGDLTYCLRKAWIPHIITSRNKLDIYSVENFRRGLGTEHSIVTILDYIHSNEETNFQMDVEFDGITGHPDFVVKDDIVYELKSTNKIDKLSLTSDNLKSYIRQITYYLLVTGIETGRIIINLNLPFHMTYERNQVRKDDDPNYLYRIKYHHKNNQLPYYFLKLTIPKDDPLRDRVKDILVNKIKPLYNHVRKNRDLTVIPRLPDFTTGGWKCKSCNVRDICNTIPDRQDNQELRNILLNKFIDDQVIIKKE